MRALGLVVALLVVAFIVLWVLFHRWLNPWRLRRHIERLEREQVRLDDLINR